MSKTTLRFVFLILLLAGLAFAQPQTVLIPQIADGGGWQTTLVLTNSTINAGSATLAFYQETSGGATQNWNLPFVEAIGQNVPVPAATTLFFHTQGTNLATSTGWAQLIVSPGIAAYAIFTLRASGRADQDGTAPGGSSAQGILVPFDNANGSVTGLALTNPSTVSETISINIKTDTGAISQATLSLPAQGHLAFALPDRLPATAGHSGLAEFYMPPRTGGGISAIALRFNATGAFTSAPVYASGGTAIIGVIPGGAK
jgi:hypothetical protein